MRDTPKTILFTALVAVAATAIACSPYDPDLGEAPFRCGTSDPICPEDYDCITEGTDSPTGVCVEKGGDAPDNPDGGGDDPDAGPFVCNNDSALEPNNNIGEATMTGIPDSQTTFNLATLAICPAGDVDVYRLRADLVGQNIQVALQTNRSVGELALELLNGTGTVITTGSYADNSNMTVTLNNAPVGTYFVQVRGSQADTQNNYTAFSITLTAP